MNPTAILGLDQSTSATKAVLYDATGTSRFEASLPHESSFPQPGWVEQDPEVLVSNSFAVLRQAVHAARDQHLDVRALGVTNQRETVVVWDRRTGRAVAPAVGWQCLRGAALVSRLAADGWARRVRKATGLPLDPHFSAPKVAWILDNVPGARPAAEAGHLAFGTVDSWLVWHLTEGRVHATDPSNASRTLLFNLAEGTWDPGLLAAFHIPASMAPQVLMSDGDFGATDLGLGGQSLPIRAVLGDSHAALFGMRCFRPGEAKATYGTGSSVMVNWGPDLPPEGGVLATSVAWGLGGTLSYVLEGNIHHSGDTLRWLVDDLGLFSSLDEWQTLAHATQGADGVYLVPAFSGLGAPYWDQAARGALVGLVRGTTKAHVARAALESLAFQVVDLVDAIRASGRGLTRLSVDGGPTRNPHLMQFQADVAGVEVAVSSAPNASVLGIALLAGWASGVWPGLEALEDVVPPGAVYRPQMDPADRTARTEGWRRAVAQTRTPEAR